MKKIIAILACFLACTFVSVSAESNADLLTKLTDLPAGISENVTRGEYSHALMGLIGKSDICDMKADGDSQFYDVYGNSEQSNAIYYLEQTGIVNGDGTGLFRPDDKIKNTEAVLMLVKAMGYKDMIDADYINSSYKIASGLGLLKNGNFSKDGTLKKDDMINLFYNALDAEIFSFESIENGNPQFSMNDQTVLSGLLEMGTQIGIVEANEMTGIKDAKGSTDNTVIISGTEYNLCDKSSDLANFLGYEVKVYYTEQDREKTIIAYEFRRNEIVEIEDYQIENYSDYTLEYTENDKIKREYFRKDVKVIYNGKYTDIFTKEMIMPKTGDLKLIKRNGKCELVIVNDYKSYVISSVDEANKTIYTRKDERSNGQFTYNLNDIEYELYDNKGKAVELDKIFANSIMSVAMSYDKEYAKIIISNQIVEGSLDKKYDDGNEIYFTINGEEYKVSGYFSQSIPSLGFGAKFYLDFKGNITYYTQNVNHDDWYFGYIIRYYMDDDDFDKTGVKILKEDNLVENILFADKVNINNLGYHKNDIKSAMELFDGDVFKKQLIKYKVNSKGQINRIQTQSDDEKMNFKMTLRGDYMYRGGTRTFAYRTYLGNATKIFVVPDKSINAPADRDYKIVDPSYLIDKSTYNIEAYSIDEDASDAAVLVVYENNYSTPSSISDYKFLFVIESIENELNADDEVMVSITAKERTNVVKANVLEDALKKIRYADKVGEYKLEVGDAIRFTKNSNDEINFIELVYDASEQKYFKPKSSGIQPQFTAVTSVNLGRAEKRATDNEGRIFVDVKFYDPKAKPEIFLMPMDNFRGLLVNVINDNKIEIEEYNFSKIKTADIYSNENASKILYMAHEGVPSSVIVYNY